MGEYGTLCEIQVTISIAGVRKRGDAAYGLDSCRRPMGVSTSCELTKKEKAIEMYICMCNTKTDTYVYILSLIHI